MSNLISLSQEERDRFAEWLEQEAKTSEGMANQMLSISTPEIFIKKEKMEMAAYLIVAKILRSTETMSL